MKVWLIEISDFLPKIDGDNRLYRAGMLGKALIEAGHDVLWWSSTFNHQLRKQRFNVSTSIEIKENYRLRLLYGPGYKRSISFGRWKHNRAVAKEFAREIVETPVRERPDIIYACLPTLEISEQAIFFGVRNSIPVVVDIRDQWPDIYLSPLPRVLRPIVRFMLKTEFDRAHRILSRATAISGVSETNLNWGLRLANRKMWPEEKWFPLGFPIPKNANKDTITAIQPSDKFGIRKKCLVVTFVGSFSPTCNFGTVVDAARIFFESSDTRVQFVLVGEGAQTSFLRRKSNKLKNVLLTGWCEKPQVEEILLNSSVGLTPYTGGAPQTLPNKPFEYMAAGLPILSSLEGELKAIIEQKGIGLQYEASNSIDLKDKIMWFLSHPDETKAMGQRAKALFEEKYNADVIYPGLVDHLTKIASGRYQANELQYQEHAS